MNKLRVQLNISEVSASAEGPAPLMTADTLRKLESLRIEKQSRICSAGSPCWTG